MCLSQGHGQVLLKLSREEGFGGGGDDGPIDGKEEGDGGALLFSIYISGRIGWGPVQEEGGITLGQADCK